MTIKNWWLGKCPQPKIRKHSFKFPDKIILCQNSGITIKGALQIINIFMSVQTNTFGEGVLYTSNILT